MTEEYKIFKETNNKRWGKVVWEVSNLGNVKKNGVTYECKKIKGSYLVFGHNCLVHRAVAQLFIENPDNKPFIDHLDTNVQNNHYTNLRWCTYSENNNNPITRKHNSNAQKGKRCGENNPQARSVAKCSLDGEILEVQPYMSAFVKQNFKVSAISECCQGKRKSHGGYKWCYADEI